MQLDTLGPNNRVLIIKVTRSLVFPGQLTYVATIMHAWDLNQVSGVSVDPLQYSYMYIL